MLTVVLWLLSIKLAHWLGRGWNCPQKPFADWLGWEDLLLKSYLCVPWKIAEVGTMNVCYRPFSAEVRASQLAQASERVGSPIPASQQG